MADEQGIPGDTTSGIEAKEPEPKPFTADLKDFTETQQRTLIENLSAGAFKFFGKKIIKPTQAVRIMDLNAAKPQKMVLKGQSRAIISMGNKPNHIIPFIWAQDSETQRPWAVFDQDEFLGKGKPMVEFKKKFKLIPFDKSPDMNDYFGNRFLAKFDLISELQIPMHINDTDEALKKRLEDKNYISEVLALARELIQYGKPKWNWRIIIIAIVVLAVAAIAIYVLATNPNILNQIASGLHLPGH